MRAGRAGPVCRACSSHLRGAVHRLRAECDPSRGEIGSGNDADSAPPLSPKMNPQRGQWRSFEDQAGDTHAGAVGRRGGAFIRIQLDLALENDDGVAAKEAGPAKPRVTGTFEVSDAGPHCHARLRPPTHPSPSSGESARAPIEYGWDVSPARKGVHAEHKGNHHSNHQQHAPAPPTVGG